MTGRVVHSGLVYIHGESTPSYLQATCQGSTQPAKLELFTNETMSKKMLDVLFTDISKIDTFDEESKRFISVMTCKSTVLTFYVKSQTEHIKWTEFCRLLMIIPAYFIPDPSHYSTIPVEFYKKEISIDQHNAELLWVAYIINEGVGKTLGCSGFHIITVGNDSTLNILDYDTEAVQVTWAPDKIRRSGCLESLVFVEGGRSCQGGPGMLWMYCPGFALKCKRCLQSFLSDKSKRTESTAMSFRTEGRSVSVDSGTRRTGGLNDSVNRDETSSFSHQVSTSTGDHSYSLPNEVCAPGKSYPPLKSAKSLPQLSVVPSELPKTSCSYQNEASSPSKPPVVPRKEKPPVPPRTKRSISQQSSEEDECMKDPTSCQCSSDVLLPNTKPVARSRSNVANKAWTYPFSDRHRKRLKTHEMVVLKGKDQTRSSSPDTSSLHSADQIGEDVLMGCSVQLHDKLDITSLHPHLSAHYLLTRDDTDILTNVTTTNSSKITHLLKVLPRKDKGWFDKFLICLHNSSEGNGHAGLVKDLKSKFKELSGSEHSLDKQNMTEVVPKENSESYPVYLEIPNESSTYTFTVMPTDLVESLMQRIGRKLNINNQFDVMLKVAGSKRLESSRSLVESEVCKDTYLSMVTQSTSS